LALSVLLIVLLGGGCSSRTTRSTCDVPRGGIEDGSVRRAQLTVPRYDQAGGLLPGTAFRDRSVTVVVLCLHNGPELVAAELVQGSTRLESTGGTFEQTGEGGWYNYLFFPPTIGKSWNLKIEGRPVGTFTFPPPPVDTCDLRARPPFHLVACGMMIVLDWTSDLSIRPERVVSVDGEVKDGALGEDLGYFFLGTSLAERGLKVRFAFFRRARTSPEFRLIEVLLSGNNYADIPSALRASLPIELSVAQAD